MLFIYLAHIALDLAWGNLFGNLGVDFAAFWSAGHIANLLGYEAAYDLDLLSRVQAQLLPPRAAFLAQTRIIPTPYLPVFLLPFQALALLPARLAAGLWMGLNLMGTLTYVRCFALRIGAGGSARRLRMLLMVSVPVFLNIFLGQANLWLLICMGEFVLAHRAGRDFRSGAWLAGLLLKPQCLLLILPAILLQRRREVAAGISVAGATIIFVSWLLAGTAGLAALARLWIGYAGGLPTNDIQLMMNWRMIGFYLQVLVGSGWAQGIVFVGMAVTSILAIVLWLPRFDAFDPRSDIAILGVMAATTLVAWHSHVHMAVILIPPLLALAVVPQLPVGRVVGVWIWLPAVLSVLRIFLAALTRLGALPDTTYGALDLLAGLGLFVADLVLLLWSLGRIAPWTRGPARVAV